MAVCQVQRMPNGCLQAGMPADGVAGCGAVNMERVDDLIDRVLKKFPGESASAQARYYKKVYQELAPLARNIEQQRDRLLEALWNCATDEGPNRSGWIGGEH